jgi:DNA-binding LacI/PurR family transcriptional regulator
LGPLGARERAFRETVARYSPAIEWKVVANMDGIDGGRAAAREILQSGFNPTAVICTNDFMALGVLHELREAGLRIPREVSVTGFDNIKLGEISAPALTTLHIPRARIGQLMFQLLREEQDSAGAAGRELIIDPEFVLRGSTGPAPERSKPGKL